MDKKFDLGAMPQGDPEEMARWADMVVDLAWAETTPPEVLEDIVAFLERVELDDFDTSECKYLPHLVLSGLLENQAVPAAVLRRLFVYLASLKHCWPEGELAQLAFHRNTPPGVLEQIADDFVSKVEPGSSDCLIGEGLIYNPNVPPDLLIKLAGFGNCDLMRAMTDQKRTPIDLLVQHLECPAEYCQERLRNGLLGRPDTPEHVKAFLALSGVGDETF